MQKSLQGLDNTTAEGTEAIDNVTDVLKTLGDHGSEATWVKDAEQKKSRRQRDTLRLSLSPMLAEKKLVLITALHMP